MKVIRPETSQKQEVKPIPIFKEENLSPESIIKKPFIPVIDEPQTIEDIMNDVLNNSNKYITFSVTLTKRQYELYTQKGGICWLKKALVGQANIRKKKK